MTNMDHLELLEAWAWVRVGHLLMDWDFLEPGPRKNFEYRFLGHLRAKYPHVPQIWYTRALWNAKQALGYDTDGLWEEVQAEIRSSFHRKNGAKNPLAVSWEYDAIKNLPKVEQPFHEEARRLSYMALETRAGKFDLALWFRSQGMSIGGTALADFHMHYTAGQITYRLKQLEKENTHV